MKKIAAILIIFMMILALGIPSVYAAVETLTVHAGINNSTKVVTISGLHSSGAGKQITIQVVYPKGELYVNQVISGTGGAYSLSYTLADPVEGSPYLVKVGGDGIDTPVTATFTYTAVSPGTPPPTSTPAPTPTPTAKPVETTAVVIVEPQVEGNVGRSELALAALDNAFNEATADENGVKKIVLKVEPAEGVTEYIQSLPGVFFTNSTQGPGLKKLIEINTTFGSMTVPSNMFSNQAVDTSKISLSIGAADVSGFPPEVREKIANKPVVEIKAMVDGKTFAWENNDAPVEISIDYTPTQEELENPEHIVVYYIDGAGNMQTVPSGRYDPATGKVTFSIVHFSTYAVSYVFKTFTDLDRYAWVKNMVEVLAAKGITSGTSPTTYSPEKLITRADFVTMLIKTLGLAADVDSNFTDIAKTSYYYNAVGIAKKLGISSGVGNNKFNPNTAITRQEMVVMVNKALAAVHRHVVKGSASDLAKYRDANLIAAQAVDGFANLIRTGILAGDGATAINPLSPLTRAQAAVVLYKAYNLK